MKLVTYRPYVSGAPTVGVLEGDDVVNAAALLAQLGEDPAPANSMEGFLQLPKATLKRVGEAAGKAAGGDHSLPLANVRLEAPIMRPSRPIPR